MTLALSSIAPPMPEKETKQQLNIMSQLASNVELNIAYMHLQSAPLNRDFAVHAWRPKTHKKRLRGQTQKQAKPTNVHEGQSKKRHLLQLHHVVHRCQHAKRRLSNNT